MNHFDIDMVALVSLMFLFGVIVFTFFREMIIPLIGLFLAVLMVWGDDICSRKDRLTLYMEHFSDGGEIICKDDNAKPLLLSQSQGWELKDRYLFKGSRGIDMLNDKCEIVGKREPHCIPLVVQIISGALSLIALFGSMGLMFVRMNKRSHKNQEDESNNYPHTFSDTKNNDEDNHDTSR